MNPEVIKNLKKTLTGKASNCTPGSAVVSKPVRLTEALYPRYISNVYYTTKLYQKQQKISIEIWLILPVVICLFQGLSHACLRITALQESAHGSLHQTKTAAIILRFPQDWIPWRNAKLIHESDGRTPFHTGDVLALNQW